MPDEARLELTEHGIVPKGDGWFVVNARETPWWQSDYFGASTSFAIVYPVSELARKHGAGAEQETGVPREAYAPLDRGVYGPMPDGTLPG